MSETRALREKLEEGQAELRRAREHLEKLRAHQAREREALQQELEAAQREVSGLRRQLQPRPPPAPPEEPEPVSGAPTTALVALARTPAPLELPRLAKLLNLTVADLRFRMGPKPPCLLARLPLAQAAELRATLRAEGFLVTGCPVPLWGVSRLAVKRFTLEEHSMSVESAQGEPVQVRYAEVRLLMKGRRITTQVDSNQETETVTHAYGDLHQHRVTKTVETRRDQVENYLWVLGKNVRLAFTQTTHYTGLGALRAASVFENLQRLTQELRRRAPHAVVDERFFQQSKFVMPLVDPGRGQELLAELLFQSIEEGLWI